MELDENELENKQDINYPLFSFNPNNPPIDPPHSTLKLKPRPKLKVGSNKEIVKQGKKTFS
jgi:hypothetical protein